MTNIIGLFIIINLFINLSKASSPCNAKWLDEDIRIDSMQICASSVAQLGKIGDLFPRELFLSAPDDVKRPQHAFLLIEMSGKTIKMDRNERVTCKVLTDDEVRQLRAAVGSTCKVRAFKGSSQMDQNLCQYLKTARAGINPNTFYNDYDLKQGNCQHFAKSVYGVFSTENTDSMCTQPAPDVLAKIMTILTALKRVGGPDAYVSKLISNC